MGYLSGLREYLDEKYEVSAFATAHKSGAEYVFYLHSQEIVHGRVTANDTYDVTIDIVGEGERLCPKIAVKCFSESQYAESLHKQIKKDTKIAAKGLEQQYSPQYRYHIKNKSLYPLREERKPLIFTLLEGEAMKGIVADFSRYEITLHLKKGVPVVICRHAIYSVVDKKKRSYMKNFQESARDWQKSQLYVSQNL